MGGSLLFFSSGLATADGEDVSARGIKDKIKKLVDEEDPKKPLTDQAIELGLSVVCDKPFALDAAAATRSAILRALAMSSRELPTSRVSNPGCGLV